MNLTKWQHFIIAISVIVISQISCGQQQSTRVRLNGYSMEPNFSDGQIFTIEEIPVSELKRGDLVLVELGKVSIIKRLIGLPNETISIHDGKVFINGTLLVESYEVVPSTYTVDEIKLDDNSYYILGDNRPDSKDSHLIGPVKGSTIQGKATP
jgi:signal peptidase I